MFAPSDSGGTGAAPGGEVSVPDHWSEAETWAWDEIRAGRPANFHAGFGELDPKTPEGWDDTRKLGQAFLETILLDEPYRGAIPRRGVRILGAWFPEPIDLVNARVADELWLDHSRFEASVQLRDMKVNGVLSLQGSRFGDTLDMDRLQVDGNLFMRGGAEFANVNLIGAKVGGQLDMDGSRFGGTLDMDSLQVDGSLFMRSGAEFGEVDLRSAKVGGQLSMTGTRIGGMLNMDSLQVDGSLFMRSGAEFGEVDLRSAKVGGQLDMDGSRIGGMLNMNRLQVHANLFMRNGVFFEKEVDLTFAIVGSNLDISGARFVSVDLSGTRIAGELRMGSGEHPATTWDPGARLVLRNTHVGALQDREESWPETLELEGFTYGRLGGLGGAGAEGDMAQRPAKLFIDWLARDRSFSPQPYWQLAEVFRAAGQTGKVHDVLYAGRERERNAAAGATWWTSGLKWWGLFLLMVTIGYGLGYRYFRALGWVVGLVLLGAIVLAVTGEGPAHGMPWGLSYSLDLLLPVVQLVKSHYAIELDGFARYYFYAHKLMGYVLASFLIAGLAGLTQK